MFSNNYDYHKKNYIEDFNGITFSNVCEYLDEFKKDISECQSFSQGILIKGMYSTLVK